MLPLISTTIGTNYQGCLHRLCVKCSALSEFLLYPLPCGLVVLVFQRHKWSVSRSPDPRAPTKHLPGTRFLLGSSHSASPLRLRTVVIPLHGRGTRLRGGGGHSQGLNQVCWPLRPSGSRRISFNEQRPAGRTFWAERTESTERGEVRHGRNLWKEVGSN